MWVVVTAMKVGTVVLPLVVGPSIAYTDRASCEKAIAPMQERIAQIDAALVCRQYKIEWTK